MSSFVVTNAPTGGQLLINLDLVAAIQVRDDSTSTITFIHGYPMTLDRSQTTAIMAALKNSPAK